MLQIGRLATNANVRDHARIECYYPNNAMLLSLSKFVSSAPVSHLLHLGLLASCELSMS